MRVFTVGVGTPEGDLDPVLALYAESGVCIDLDRDGACQEDRELFYDGSVVPFPEGARRLELRFP